MKYDVTVFRTKLDMLRELGNNGNMLIGDKEYLVEHLEKELKGRSFYKRKSLKELLELIKEVGITDIELESMLGASTGIIIRFYYIKEEKEFLMEYSKKGNVGG